MHSKFPWNVCLHRSLTLTGPHCILHSRYVRRGQLCFEINKIYPPLWLNVTLRMTLPARLLVLVMLIRYRNTSPPTPLSFSLPVCLHMCVWDIGVGRGGGGGHRILLLGNVSVRTALLHLRPAIYTRTHPQSPSAPAQSSSVTAAHMWPKYSKQSFIKSSTKTAQCDSRGTNDAWRPLNAPLTDQRPACHAHVHNSTGFPFWHAQTNSRNHYGSAEHMLAVANTQMHTNWHTHAHTHTPCAQGHLSAA